LLLIEFNMDIITIILFSYICGSIPFGFILTKIFIKKDIREIGSGNIGATNVLRSGNKYLAIATLVLDMLKGYAVVTITAEVFPSLIQVSALIVFLGHIFPIWLKFKGGKGVATYLGILFALSISLGILFIFTWLVVSLIFKYSSVSSMFGSITVLLVNFFRHNILMAVDPSLLSSNNLNFLLLTFFILILFTHRKNISNLKNKIEEKIKI
jgi:acyl phosphate:glycerol-3-phosphate acyltransferase